MPTAGFLRLLATLAVALTAAGQANAFCLKNASNKWVHVDRILTADGTRLRYKADVLPGKEACCDWRDRTCNPTGLKNENLTFSIYGLPDKSGMSPGAWEFVLPAGGRVEVVDVKHPKFSIEPKLFLE